VVLPLLLLALLLVAAPALQALPPPAPPPAAVAWRELRAGLDFGHLEVETATRAGSTRLAILRVDPARYQFRVLAGEVGDEGFSAAQWRQQSAALAVFNAGQFTPQHAYLGLLIQDGRQLTRPVSNMEAILVAEPEEPGLPLARIIDLQYTSLPLPQSPYRQAAQSLMLVDRFGQIRVRRSGKVAHRTLVAEDGQGRILVMISEGKHTLWDLARFIADAGLGLREVMCMDGGAEAQLDLLVDGIAYQQTGGPKNSPDLPLPWPAAYLPAALGIFAR
jgi:uncharacterized protein YigE (DUF2233 family)